METNVLIKEECIFKNKNKSCPYKKLSVFYNSCLKTFGSHLVFNGDETGFQTCPSTGCVLGEKGAENVYSIDEGSFKENITVMFSFSANGKKCCPMIVYPYKRIPGKIA